MSYLNETERLLGELESLHGVKSRYSVAFVRVGSFRIRVTVFEPEPVRAKTFNLSTGLTPATRLAIRKWFESVVAPVQAAGDAPAETSSSGPPKQSPATRGQWRYALPAGVSLKR